MLRELINIEQTTNSLCVPPHNKPKRDLKDYQIVNDLIYLKIIYNMFSLHLHKFTYIFFIMFPFYFLTLKSNFEYQCRCRNADSQSAYYLFILFELPPNIHCPTFVPLSRSFQYPSNLVLYIFNSGSLRQKLLGLLS